MEMVTFLLITLHIQLYLSVCDATNWQHVSKMFSAILASPSAWSAIRRITISDRTAWSSCVISTPTPVCINKESRCNAECKTRHKSSTVRHFSGMMRQRDSNAYPSPQGTMITEFIEKDGFSVVAPIRTNLPLSTWGRNKSCCFLLKRWISSINRIDGTFRRRYSFSALSAMLLISSVPAIQQESE